MPEIEKPAILLTNPSLKFMAEPLIEEFTLVDLGDISSMEREAKRIRAILFLGHNKVSAELINSLPNLRLLVSPSSGIEGIDLKAAHARGLTVTSGGNTHISDVARYTVSLTVAARCELLAADHYVRGGGWRARPAPKFRRSIGSDRVGIIGLGPIGYSVAIGMQSFCREIGWWGPRPKDVPWPRKESLLALAEWSDIVILCARSDAGTAKLVGANAIDAIGPQGLFVNIARGFMVDEDALIDALKAGRLGSAALDVFTEEPADPARWREVPNVLLSPHVAGITVESRDALKELVVYNVRTLVTGETPRNVVGE